jgi:hypothetical protein
MVLALLSLEHGLSPVIYLPFITFVCFGFWTCYSLIRYWNEPIVRLNSTGFYDARLGISEIPWSDVTILKFSSIDLVFSSNALRLKLNSATKITNGISIWQWLKWGIQTKLDPTISISFLFLTASATEAMEYIERNKFCQVVRV